MYRIGFFGDGLWAQRLFERILSDQSIEIAFVCLRSVEDEDLKGMVTKSGVPCFSFQNVNDESVERELYKYNCDIYVSMSYDQIFKLNLINQPKDGIINCHAGMLPEYRGRNALTWAMINDEPCFGVTVHFVDEGIDTGDIILQESCKICDDDCYRDVLEKAAEKCSELTYEVLLRFSRSLEVESKAQLTDKGFYCKRRGCGDEFIDWSQKSRQIFCFVRALSKPGPGAGTMVNGAVLTIHDACYTVTEDYEHYFPGTVISVEDRTLNIKTCDGILMCKTYSCSERLSAGDRCE